MKQNAMVNPYKSSKALSTKKAVIIISTLSLLVYYFCYFNSDNTISTKSDPSLSSSSSESSSESLLQKNKPSSSSITTTYNDIKQSTDDKKITTTKKQQQQSYNSLPNLSLLTEIESKCPPLQFKPTKPKESWSNKKPIWFASMHHSMEDNIFKNMIQYLTQMNQAGKSFYASIKGSLRHCISTTSETAVCAIGDTPTRNLDNYHDKYMIFVRSPRLVFPYVANMKAMKYSGLVGQMKIENWRSLRDEYLDGMIDGWIQHIMNWNKMTQYTLGMYIVYEDLMDYEKGPGVFKKMANVLNEGGFDTVQSDDEIRCAWLMSLGKESIMKFNEKEYDFDEYIPGYKAEQKQTMIAKLTNFMNEIGDSDKELESIVSSYIKDIEEKMVIDES